MKIDCQLRIEYRASARANSRYRQKASLIIEKAERKYSRNKTAIHTFLLTTISLCPILTNDLQNLTNKFYFLDGRYVIRVISSGKRQTFEVSANQFKY